MINLNIALPKGRLGDKSYALLKQIGLDVPDYTINDRKLILTNEELQIRLLLVKPSDVPIYVDHGVADLGIVGKDVLNESDAHVLELLDLGFGRCHFALAAPEGFVDKPYQRLMVATKYLKTAKAYYRDQNREVDLIHLNGSVELAPLVGLSDVIIDVVETGQTLKENHLVVLDEFSPISARLIANHANYRFKSERIDAIVRRIQEVTHENTY